MPSALAGSRIPKVKIDVIYSEMSGVVWLAESIWIIDVVNHEWSWTHASIAHFTGNKHVVLVLTNVWTCVNMYQNIALKAKIMVWAAEFLLKPLWRIELFASYMFWDSHTNHKTHTMSGNTRAVQPQTKLWAFWFFAVSFTALKSDPRILARHKERLSYSPACAMGICPHKDFVFLWLPATQKLNDVTLNCCFIECQILPSCPTPTIDVFRYILTTDQLRMAGFRRAISQQKAQHVLEIGCGPWAPLVTQLEKHPTSEKLWWKTVEVWIVTLGTTLANETVNNFQHLFCMNS